MADHGYPLELKTLLDAAVSRNASDLHLTVGVVPSLRIDGRLVPIADHPVVDQEQAIALIEPLLQPAQLERLKEARELDFSLSYGAARVRANVYYQKGSLAASLRFIPRTIRTIQELGLPPIVEKFIQAGQGLVVITGPTGHGKSTTLAGMIELINTTRPDHIITIEDPIEYLFDHKKSIISQREVGFDTHSFGRALRAALREDPNVILVGEMRDLETIETAITIAETGHLVLTTLHTNSAGQTPDRIIDVFPPHQQRQIRMQLANVLLGVVSQRLLPKTAGGRIVACEVMVANNAIRNLIREGKTHQIDNIIHTSAAEGMIGLDKVLAELVSKGDVSLDDALTWSLDPRSFKTMVY
ncbi:type IV pilus twitching motility protein PilT [Candidatus Berkelbacteria bacterium]|nr:type IV pilus twitching motility protein PilT [Candidatus Berkelbacteria bacterium]